MTDADRVLNALRTASAQVGEGDTALVSEAAVGNALHMSHVSVRNAAHVLARAGLVRIRQGINYELYEVIGT